MLLTNIDKKKKWYFLMSAFQIGVGCTSQVSSWSFCPPKPDLMTALPFLLGDLTRKTLPFFGFLRTFPYIFFLSNLIAVFYSCLLSLL